MSYYIIGIIIANIMTCDMGDEKKIYLGMNFNQLLIFLFSDTNFDYNFPDMFYCLSQDEETIFKYFRILFI